MSTLTRWARARYRFFQARIRHLMQNERWTEALTALIDLGGWLQGRTEDSQIWLEQMITATQIAAHLEDPAEYRAFLAHFGEPFLAKQAVPSALLSAFASIADQVDPAVMVAVGRWLTDARQRWPLGPYLMAHFASADADPTAVARQFARAQERAHRAQLPRWEDHARLRRGSLLILTGADLVQGRALLHGLDWSTLLPAERLWMARALSGSAQWSDRLRAMDIILDLHQDLLSARPKSGEITVEELKEAAAAVFLRAGLHLPEAEERRLTELLHALFTGAERARWTGYLQARRELSRVCALPFDQAQDALAMLQKLSALHPQKWRSTTHHFSILQSGVAGTYKSAPSLLASAEDSYLPIADATAALLQAIHDKTEIDSALYRLNQSLSEMDRTLESPITRQITLVWAALLKYQDRNQVLAIEPQLTELARHHTALASPPSFGWWLLSAHLFQAGLTQPGLIIADRALSSSQSEEADPYRAYVARQVLDQAIAKKDVPTTRRWLSEI